MGRLLLSLSVAALLVALAPAVAQAAVFTVDTTVDAVNAEPAGTTCATVAGRCSLRAAITAANNLTGPDTVALGAGTYTLSQGLGALRATRAVTIDGADARTTIVDGGGRTSVLWFTTSGTSRLDDVTVTGGAGGSALYLNGQDLTADRIAVRDNTIATASALGAGIRVDAGDLTLTRSAVTGNSAVSSGNQPQGGGIYVTSGASLVADTVTIAGNSATGQGVAAFGGGLITHGVVELRHATIWGNASTGNGAQGASVHVAATGSMRIADSILGGGTGIVEQCGGSAPLRSGVNLGGGAGCGFATADPLLAPLANAGGPTNVLVPAPDSPAIGAAATCFEGGADQRGQTAPAGAACDVGAAESGADLSVETAALLPAIAPDGVATFFVTVLNSGLDDAPGAVVDLAIDAGTALSASTAGGTCTGSGPIRCELGTLARGDAAGIALTVRPPDGPPPLVAVTAVASSRRADPDPADATSSATVAVNYRPPSTGPPQLGPPPGGTPPPGPTPPAAPRAPELTDVRAPGSARAGRSFKVTAALSRDAVVTVKVERQVSGRRSGRGRRASCRAGARRGRACRTWQAFRPIATRALRAGHITVTVPARVDRRRLGKGTYRLTLTARSADGLTSRPVVVRSLRLR